MAEPVALAALAIDAAFGWPACVHARIGHPVTWFGRLIAAAECRWNRPAFGENHRRLAGIVTVLLLLLVAGGGGWLIEWASPVAFGRWGWLVIALCAAPGLAQRSLDEHVGAVERALARGDILAARRAVGMIVGRDTATLNDAGIARAAIESLAESFCDGIAAPLFWLLLLGLPGLWAYKAINTADSMIGHREPRWRAFGWAAARTDDAANLLPARLSGFLVCIAGGGGWRTMWRDAGKHASPNAGWPEAAMAGALGLRLGGPLAYDCVTMPKPWIGDGPPGARAGDIRRARAIYLRACLMLWAIAGIVAWAW